jgi:hypothetical protein
MRRTAVVLMALAVGLSACTALLGVKDIYLDTDASASDDGGGSKDGPGNNDGTVGNEGGGGDGGGDGSCSDTQADPNNCGRCGHSCLGGQCTAGKCQPVELTRGPAGATGIALDTTDVYWTSITANSVHKVSKNGGTAATLAQAANGVDAPYGIFVEGGFVYWVNSALFTGTVMRCPVAGCGAAPQMVAYNVNEPTDLVVDGTNVYFTESDGTRIARAPKGGTSDGGVAVYPNTSSKPIHIALDGDHLFWIDDGSGDVQRVSIDGGNYIDLGANGLDGRGITVDQNNVYWVNLAGNVSRRAKDGGGTTTTLAAGEGNPLDIVVDGTNAYWVKVVFPNDGGLDLDGSIRTCTLSSCTGSDLATGQKHPRSIAMDANAIYWVNYADGSVMKLAKP